MLDTFIRQVYWKNLNQKRRRREERLTNVNQLNLFGFLHKLEGNSNILSLLDQHTRPWVVSGEVRDMKEGGREEREEERWKGERGEERKEGSSERGRRGRGEEGSGGRKKEAHAEKPCLVCLHSTLYRWGMLVIPHDRYLPSHRQPYYTMQPAKAATTADSEVLIWLCGALLKKKKFLCTSFPFSY